MRSSAFCCLSGQAGGKERSAVPEREFPFNLYTSGSAHVQSLVRTLVAKDKSDSLAAELNIWMSTADVLCSIANRYHRPRPTRLR